MVDNYRLRSTLGFALATLLTACASHIPDIIRNAPADAPSESEVRAHLNHHLGARVRWGGSIVNVENHAGESRIEIIARPLSKDGRPREGDHSIGRFLAAYPGFLDPEIYQKGRLLTVVGTIAGEEIHLIGQYRYPFPRVTIEALYLWEPLPAPPAYINPFGCHDPWYPHPHVFDPCPFW